MLYFHLHYQVIREIAFLKTWSMKTICISLLIILVRLCMWRIIKNLEPILIEVCLNNKYDKKSPADLLKHHYLKKKTETSKSNIWPSQITQYQALHLSMRLNTGNAAHSACKYINIRLILYVANPDITDFKAMLLSLLTSIHWTAGSLPPKVLL